MSTWYRTGTALFVNGSTSVSGSGTAWIASARTGDALHAPDGRVYEIASVNSNTSITLASEYLGSNASGADYAIQPTRGITVEFNDNAVSLLSTVQSYVDTALAGRFPDGSAGAPSHSFASDTDTGMYRDAADRIGFSAGGARRAFLSTTAMQIDVPVTGTAVTQSPTDDTAGRLMKTGSAGWLIYDRNAIGLSDFTDPPPEVSRLITAPDLSIPGVPTSQRQIGFNLSWSGGAQPSSVQMIFEASSTEGADPRAWMRTFRNGTYSDFREFYHTGNTTVDGSGNIMEASPILRLYSDGLEEPNEPAGGAFTRESAGVYKIAGVHPLASKGWRIRTPADVNGNKLVAITEPEYDAATETLTVRTFDLLWSEGRLVPGDPMDIPEGEFVMLRFDSPEEEAA